MSAPNSHVAAKAADIIGLYPGPPQKALVISVDEKPSIQALSRATGYVRTSSGKIARGLKSTYRRNGTLNLFAALQAQLLVFTAQAGQFVPLSQRQGDLGSYGLRLSSAIQAIGLGYPVPDRLGRRLKLAG